jgi:hypothetical protein
VKERIKRTLDVQLLIKKIKGRYHFWIERFIRSAILIKEHTYPIIVSQHAGYFRAIVQCNTTFIPDKRIF